VTVWRRVFRTLRDGPATERAAPVPDTATQALAAQLDGAARARLGRSLAIRHVDAGSCNGCELEIHALNNIVYDLERFGLHFVASPRHADVLLVTGPLSRNMREALLLTWQATPDPKWVVAVGDCAVDGGVFKGSYAIDGSGTGGIGAGVPVDLKVPGCPPTPAAVLSALRSLVEVNAA
jgi:Ni,Fe-hydrogenase III small subunit